MKCGDLVHLSVPTLASELHTLLASALKSNEADVYIRDEDGIPVLYLVKRGDRGRGYIMCSRPLTYLPEAV